MRGPIIVVLLAGLAGVVVALVVYSALNEREQVLFGVSAQPIKIVVAAHDLTMGSKLDQNSTKMTRWSRDSVPPGAFTDPDSVMGQYTKTDFVENEPIVAGRLTAHHMKAQSEYFPYTIRSGDTLDAIADRFGVLSDDITLANRPASLNWTMPLMAGETIRIPTGTKIRTVGQVESDFLIQEINPDTVDGIWHVYYGVPLTPTRMTLHIGDNIGYACRGYSEALASIDYSHQKVTFTKIRIGEPGGCPVCLAAGTLIETPSGLVPVRNLKLGVSVWTVDKAGDRVPGRIAETSKVQVPTTSRLVHLILDDGRELFVSDGHPTVDGRNVGDLVPGDEYDGGSVISMQRVPYAEGATYDLLPSGDTGFYWANGVLLGSTLNPR